jgi:hypothetical protein
LRAVGAGDVVFLSRWACFRPDGAVVTGEIKAETNRIMLAEGHLQRAAYAVRTSLW